MKLLGKDISGSELVEELEARLRARGLLPSPVRDEDHDLDGVEPRVDPVAFNLAALEEHSDPTRPLPLHTHRGGAGQAVVLAKWAFRKTCQVFINEALSRQRLFNGHVRDSYAQLSAEVERLQAEVERLKSAPPVQAAPPPRKSASPKKRAPKRPREIRPPTPKRK